MASGCGSVGRVAASNTRDLQFKSSHRQIIITINCIENGVEKTKIKKERPGMAHFLYELMYIVTRWLEYLDISYNEK